MPDAYDPTALVRHAVAAGDWRLVELIARMLAGVSTTEVLAAPARLRDACGDAWARVRLGRFRSLLLMEAIERLAEEFLARIPAYVWDGESAAGADRGHRRHTHRPPRARRRGSRQGARRPRTRPWPDALRAASTGCWGDLGQRRGSPAVAGTPTVHDRSRARPLAPSPRRRRTAQCSAAPHRSRLTTPTHGPRSQPPRTRPTCSRLRC